uniref:Uncharacterized protein n=1 Tax=Amphimedon queenslandica TaxID=400682 RepID=A0A1X7SRA2_AMPQE
LVKMWLHVLTAPHTFTGYSKFLLKVQVH